MHIHHEQKYKRHLNMFLCSKLDDFVWRVEWWRWVLLCSMFQISFVFLLGLALCCLLMGQSVFIERIGADNEIPRLEWKLDFSRHNGAWALICFMLIVMNDAFMSYTHPLVVQRVDVRTPIVHSAAIVMPLLQQTAWIHVYFFFGSPKWIWVRTSI